MRDFTITELKKQFNRASEMVNATTREVGGITSGNIEIDGPCIVFTVKKKDPVKIEHLKTLVSSYYGEVGDFVLLYEAEDTIDYYIPFND